VAAMPSVARELPLDQPLYSTAALIEHRRNILLLRPLVSAGLRTTSSSTSCVVVSRALQEQEMARRHAIEGTGG
jgi:hypothetical protein